MSEITRVWRLFQSDSRADTLVALVAVVSWVVLFWLKNRSSRRVTNR